MSISKRPTAETVPGNACEGKTEKQHARGFRFRSTRLWWCLDVLTYDYIIYIYICFVLKEINTQNSVEHINVVSYYDIFVSPEKFMVNNCQ